MSFSLPPVNLFDLSIMLLMGEILVLITLKIASPLNGLGTHINRKKLENTAVVAGALFLVIVVIRIIDITT